MARVSLQEEMFDLFHLLLQQHLEREQIDEYNCSVDSSDRGGRRVNERLHEPRLCQRTALLS